MDPFLFSVIDMIILAGSHGLKMRTVIVYREELEQTDGKYQG